MIWPLTHASLLVLVMRADVSLKDTPMNGGAVLWVGVILCSVGALIALLGLGMMVQDWRAARRGKRVTGRVVDHVIQRDPGHLSFKIYVPVFEFHNEVGAAFRVQSTYGSRPPVHKVGDEVVVRYDPADPERAEIVGEGRWMTVLLLVFGTIVAAIGGACLVLR